LDRKLAGTPTASMAVSTPRPPVIFKTFSTALPSLLLMTAGIMLKIETKTAFNQLPDLLLRAMRHPPIAVMIARGDLGVARASISSCHASLMEEASLLRQGMIVSTV
jgi:pyruvate kinase